jgi:sterol desaturase/sphingolipid hydroxylase (fatty acid hydroxylase superfamily)
MSTTDFLDYIEFMSFNIYDWTLVFAFLFLALELLNEAVTKRFTGARILETFSSMLTQVPYYFTEAVVFGGGVYLYFTIYEFIPWKVPVNGYSAMLVLFLADFTYYVEHYALHRIRALWLAHSVHHSSGVYNTATAFRFSMFDPLVSVVFHLPLLLMGFNPILIFAAEITVQAYQFWIHNEMVGKLGPLESIFNTPSHHRVHHGSNRKYLDKNFGGILIIWDKIFGTFQKEEELPTYGLTTPMTSKNPITVQFFEFGNLYKDLMKAESFSECIGYFVKPPGWRPQRLKTKIKVKPEVTQQS